MGTIVELVELSKMYDEKCVQARVRIFGEEGVEVRRGYVNTTRELVLTSDASVEAAPVHSEKWKEKKVDLQNSPFYMFSVDYLMFAACQMHKTGFPVHHLTCPIANLYVGFLQLQLNRAR